MKGIWLRVSAMAMAGLLTGCGGLKQVTHAIQGGRDPYAGQPPGSEIPPHLRAGGGASPQVRTRLAPVGEDPAALERRQGGGSAADTVLTPEEDIVWTDPDNPDAELPGLEDMIRASKTRGSWEVSYTEAKKLALREGRPLLVWFTDSKRSPVCKTLSTELFSTPDFDSWAREELVRLRLDFDVKGDGGDGQDQMDTELRKREYLRGLEKHLKASGKPYVLVMAPDGAVIGRYRGYRTNSADFFWGQLKHSTILARKHHEDWVKKMERKGYRHWSNRAGDFRVFARLLRYREGTLILVEPDGSRFQTHERNLSEGDRLWIEGQKARRQ